MGMKTIIIHKGVGGLDEEEGGGVGRFEEEEEVDEEWEEE